MNQASTNLSGPSLEIGLLKSISMLLGGDRQNRISLATNSQETELVEKSVVKGGIKEGAEGVGMCVLSSQGST